MRNASGSAIPVPFGAQRFFGDTTIFSGATLRRDQVRDRDSDHVTRLVVKLSEISAWKYDAHRKTPCRVPYPSQLLASSRSTSPRIRHDHADARESARRRSIRLSGLIEASAHRENAVDSRRRTQARRGFVERRGHRRMNHGGRLVSIFITRTVEGAFIHCGMFGRATLSAESFK